MDSKVLQVPASLLLNPAGTAPAKLVWMALRLHPDAGPAKVEALTGLSRHTVLNGLAQAADLRHPREGPRTQIPVALLAEKRVRAPAKLLYGLLQTLPTFRSMHGQFTYRDLAGLTRLSPNTLKRAMSELIGSGWVRLTQKTRLSPFHFKLGTPEQRSREAEAAVASRRLKRAKFGGEAIMQEYLSLLIDSTDFTDNARPGFLVNPLTQERLELDRFYRVDKVAFEYHGEQHERATGRFTQKQVDDQRLRDLITAGLCVYEGIHLVIIRAEDLSLQGMIAKVGSCMPLRGLAGQERLIDVLENASIAYLAGVQNARKSGV